MYGVTPLSRPPVRVSSSPSASGFVRSGAYVGECELLELVLFRRLRYYSLTSEDACRRSIRRWCGSALLVLKIESTSRGLSSSDGELGHLEL